ncbi:MAG: hypothetical protein ABIB71_07395 [Candidatus Woesearchaeota archaeon]
MITVMKVMLDTNIFVDFMLVQWKREKNQPIPRALRKSEKILTAYFGRKFVNFASEWNILEFRDVVERFVTEIKLIENGYSLQEFSEGRKKLPLTESEIKRINYIVEDAFKLSEFRSRPLIQEDFKLIKRVCSSGFSLLDVIHLYNANNLNCDYFITRDKQLIRGFNAKKDRAANLMNEKIKIISREQFTKKLNN